MTPGPYIGAPRAARRIGRWVLRILSALLLITVLWWASGRITADDRRLAVRGSVAPPAAAPADGRLRILAWNIAHGRGDARPGLLQNWRGGSSSERLARLRRMAGVLRNVDADVVVLNEVDFEAGWSGGVNQAEFLADSAGYGTQVQQRSFDVRTPFETWAFGNAILSRLPVREATWLDLPAHSRVEEAVAGSKDAVVVRLETGGPSVGVVAIHLEFRSEETRLRAVPSLDSTAAAWASPLILAGDFNTAPPDWPATGSETALGRLLAAGWRSPRALGPPAPEELTFPAWAPQEARDWIVVEPPLRVVETEVLHAAAGLSDHAPVVAVVELP